MPTNCQSQLSSYNSSRKSASSSKHQKAKSEVGRATLNELRNVASVKPVVRDSLW